jgi:metal-responsive CopG/Arc/MetJ family transcriptional regulator
MTAVTIQLNDAVAQKLRHLAETQERSEADIIHEAVAAYVETARPLPKGLGKYHSGMTDGSEKARDLLRQAAKDKQWP